MENRKNNLSKSQKGGMLESLFLCLAPMLFWVCVKEALCTGLFITLLMVIKYARTKKANAASKGLVPSKFFYVTFGSLTAIIVGIMACHMIFCHRAKTEDTNTQPEEVVVVPEEQIEEVESDDKTEETTSTNSVDPNARRTTNGALDKHGKYTNPDGTLKDAIEKKTEANNPNKAPAKAETTTGKTENTIVDNTNAKADEKTEQIIEEAKKDDNKKVEDYKNDIVVITTPAKEDKKVEETKSVDPAKDIKVVDEKIEDLTSKDTKVEEETAISKETEDDGIVEESDEELAKLFETVKEEVKEEVKEDNNKAEVEETKVEEPKAEEVEEVVETKSTVVEVEETMEINNEAKGNVVVEEVKEDNTKNEVVETKSVEEVKVVAIDGYTATVGSTVQFKVSGDDVKIDGLDGIDYTFNNGVLSINTGSEATVLTVEASNSVNTVSFDITINGIAQ